MADILDEKLPDLPKDGLKRCPECGSLLQICSDSEGTFYRPVPDPDTLRLERAARAHVHARGYQYNALSGTTERELWDALEALDG